MPEEFAGIRFGGTLRDNQERAAAAIRKQLARGERRLHIVAPPGSGKTVLGLYVWAELMRTPAAVLSPTSAIQSQWLSRASLFGVERRDERLSDDPGRPGLLTSLTYQAVTMPARADEELDHAARSLWIETLVADGHADDPDEAAVWVDDLRARNPAYHDKRLASYRRKVTEARTYAGEATSTLHAGALDAIRRLRERGVGLVILDECHHLLGHWGRVLADAHDLLDGPVVLGLTATPPDERGRDERDTARYAEFLGEVDFEVPIPAVVKEGHLAPYQDLVHFVRPTPDELEFVAGADRALHELVEELCAHREQPAVESGRVASLPEWLAETLATRRLPTGTAKTWNAFARRDETLAWAGPLFLHRRGVAIPEGVPSPDAGTLADPPPEDAVAVAVLDRYVRHALRRSASPEDHALAERVVDRLRLLGVQITETGSRPCASPVGRVLAYSKAKAAGVVEVLKAERRTLGESIRAVVVTDFERTSAQLGAAGEVADETTGGAIAVFRALLSDEETDALDPVLVTGSTILVDDDLVDRFLGEARAWLAEHATGEVTLEAEMNEAFGVVTGRGEGWGPRLYVAMITALFQAGVTRCLVGTRGLLGEGWDAAKTNVLIDLTAVTTSMSVNQLRGRSIRLDPELPGKVANNWDVICTADEFARGLSDYERFRDRHATWYGVTEDGQVEKGVGHVHASFTDLAPESLAELMPAINAEMLGRASRRDEARGRWDIGGPFEGVATPMLEARPSVAAEGQSGGFPVFQGQKEAWSEVSLTRAVAKAVLGALRDAGLVERGDDTGLQVTARSGGYVRVMAGDLGEDECSLFMASLAEALGPIDRPRYIIERVVRNRHETLLSRLLPGVIGRYFRRTRLEVAMLHAVPSALARNKELADVYRRHWGAHVGPGRVLYTHRGEGEKVLHEALAGGMTPRHGARAGEVFR
ncbi:MAG: DEAD/DEAH box helicase family protein [Phycisphaerales bacterium JB040]